MADNGRQIGGDEVFSFSLSHHHGSGIAQTGCDQPIRRLPIQSHYGVSPPQLPHDLAKGRLKGAQLFCIETQQLGDHFRIGLGAEWDPPLQEALLQLQVVFHNAVLDHHNAPALVALGVGIFFGHAAVGGPAGMSDPYLGGGHVGGELHQQVVQLAGSADNSQSFFGIHCGNAGRIIAPILQGAQALQQDGGSPLKTHVADNATHSSHLNLSRISVA